MGEGKPRPGRRQQQREGQHPRLVAQSSPPPGRPLGTGGTQVGRHCTTPPATATARWSRFSSPVVPGAPDLFPHSRSHTFAEGCSHSFRFSDGHTVFDSLRLDLLLTDVSQISTMFHFDTIFNDFRSSSQFGVKRARSGQGVPKESAPNWPF